MGRFSKELYDRNVIIKSAYLFTDKYYIHIDTDQEAFIVTFISKESDNADEVEMKYENESMFITLALIMFFIMIHFCLMAVQGAIISRLSEIGSSGMHCGLTQEDVEKYIDLEEDYDDAEENIKLCEEILNENKEEVINEEIKDDEINSTPGDQEHDQV